MHAEEFLMHTPIQSNLKYGTSAFQTVCADVNPEQMVCTNSKHRIILIVVNDFTQLTQVYCICMIHGIIRISWLKLLTARSISLMFKKFRDLFNFTIHLDFTCKLLYFSIYSHIKDYVVKTTISLGKLLYLHIHTHLHVQTYKCKYTFTLGGKGKEFKEAKTRSSHVRHQFPIRHIRHPLRKRNYAEHVGAGVPVCTFTCTDT